MIPIQEPKARVSTAASKLQLCETRIADNLIKRAAEVWAAFQRCHPSPDGKKLFFYLNLRGPTRTNETIHWVVGDEELIVAGDHAFALERTLCKRWSGGRLLQEGRSIDFQASPA
jgi:hypothetical protein